MTGAASPVSELIEAENRGGLREAVLSMPARDRLRALEQLDAPRRRRALDLLSDGGLDDIFRHQNGRSIAALLSDLPSDDVTDVLLLFNDKRREGVLVHLPEPLRSRARHFLAFGKDTAGGIMAGEYIAFSENETVQSVVNGLRRMAPEQERAFYLYVVDDQNRLKGVVSMRDLVIRPGCTPLREILQTRVITVPAGTDEEEVARLFQKHRLLALPVVDEQHRMIGVITVDDVAEVIQREATEDMLKLSGIPSGEESIHAPIAQAVKKRLPWLAFNMLLDCVAVSVVAVYQGTIEAVVAIAVLMPIISDMGGNTGFQNLSLIIRGLATGEVTPRDFRRILWRQSVLGLIMGAALGLQVALLAYVWQWNPMLGLLAGAAMFSNIYIASLIGAVLPLALKGLRIDPAVATGPLMTTLTDLSGFFVTLWLATRFLPHLT